MFEGTQTWFSLRIQVDESGKALDEESVELEHHAPDCKTMSRARGKPFYIGQYRYDGPPALRDEYNVTGFPSLRGESAVRVRQGNRMALKSTKRCSALHDAGKKFSMEHPYRSFLWYMKPVVDLASKPGVYMAVFSNCCFGGRRRKWTSLLTNCREIFDAMNYTPIALMEMQRTINRSLMIKEL